MRVPTDKKKLINFALDTIEKCQTSRNIRAAYYRTMNQIMETGRQDGSKSLMNMLFKHVDRSASHMFSPTDLRFMLDFENEYPRNILDRAKVVARIVTRTWDANNTDVVFGQGVFESLKYGAVLLKQWTEIDDETPVYQRRLVMPWQFGVYREDENDLNKQSALLETSMLTLEECWRRIYYLPDAERIYRQLESNVSQERVSDVSNSYFHQVLSASTLQVGTNVITKPGGIVNFGNDPNYAIIGPEVAADMVKFHELWVMDDDTGDYTTIQLVEPDILVAPRFIAQGIGTKKSNLLIAGGHHGGKHPYTLIQPNMMHGYFWGRPELVDLIEPQTLLSTTCEDAKRLFGLQVEKFLGIMGFDGLTDEVYDEQRSAGYLSVPSGGSVTDLTPKFPEQTLPMIAMLKETINEIGGFPPVMAGQGEAGVRAGVHADTLMKTGSPTLRDRSLLVERQCAMAADLTLSLKEAKDGNRYWTKADSLKDAEETSFILNDLPADWRVTVDSHSSSPIFMDNHAQLVFAGVKMGMITKHMAIDLLPFPHKELLHASLREEEQKQAQLIQQHPEILAKLAGGKGRR